MRRLTLGLVALLCLAAPAAARERYALIVAGAAGGPPYDAQYVEWTERLSRVLEESLGFDQRRVTVLRDAADPSMSPTAASVRAAIDAIRRQTTRDDLVFVMLIGHGTFDGVDAKLNLVGPDLEAREWAALLDRLPARLVVVNAASAGFPFLERLAGRRRVVISATDTAEQRYDTIFPEYFIRALTSTDADLDKNGRISVWEAFAAATSAVRRAYQSLGQLATERGLLDDTGDGVGHEADGTSDDGREASGWYLDEPPANAAPTDQALVRLLQRKRALELSLSDLRIRRAFLSAPEFDAEFERIMVELARVNREIREKGGT